MLKLLNENDPENERLLVAVPVVDDVTVQISEKSLMSRANASVNETGSEKPAGALSSMQTEFLFSSGTK
jgi:hypothetical protein